MGRIDGTSRYNNRPAGVADAFQIKTHSVEPILANRSRNLFSHDDRGPDGTDETEEDGPEVALVRRALLLTGGAEGLAGSASSPQGALVGPSGKTGGKAPAADTGEKVALCETAQVRRSHVENRPLINFPFSYQIFVYEVTQPLGGVRLHLVVIRAHKPVSRAHSLISSRDHRQA